MKISNTVVIWRGIIASFAEPVKNGNAVIVSEADYNGLLEMLYLSDNPAMKEKITEGLNTPPDECVPESEVQW